MQYHLKTILFLLFLNFCISQQPADKEANAKTKAILDFIAGLPKQSKYLSGQFARFTKVNFNMSEINKIANLTGHAPAIVGCDYVAGWAFAIPPQSDIDYSCNEYLKDHSNKHGLITINTHYPNPVSPNGGDLRNRSSLTFTDLLKPEQKLQSNVTVLYRPFHEMNGGWFWWGQQDPSEYKSVWISVFNYFYNEKRLHNLLWVYAPDQSAPTPSKYYPGDDDEMIKLNKPFALGKVGPHTINGNFDYSLWYLFILV